MEKNDAPPAIDVPDCEIVRLNQDGSERKPPKPEGRKREEWDHPLEFLFSCISLSVGL
ncbi:unnamed protein product, partial [Allacma fusca]